VSRSVAATGAWEDSNPATFTVNDATLTGSFLVSAHATPGTSVEWPLANRDRDRFGWLPTITEVR
jgi:hypothetical protein